MLARQATRLVAAAPARRISTQTLVRRGGAHDHHDHRVFDPSTFNPLGAPRELRRRAQRPVAIFLGTFVGGISTVGIAVKLQQSKWNK